MNWFLDMCILIFYAEIGGKNYEKTTRFIKEKKEKKFLLCFYITKENMPKWINREKIILKLISKKIQEDSLNIENMKEYKYLTSRDIVKLKKLLAQCFSSPNKEEYYERLKRNQIIMLSRINYFLTKLIDKEVIPIKEIDFELKSTLFTFLQNHSDAMTLASGIQYNQIEELKILTGDKKDWNKDNILWVYDSRPDLAKKYSKIPKINYIQSFEN